MSYAVPVIEINKMVGPFFPAFVVGSCFSFSFIFQRQTYLSLRFFHYFVHSLMFISKISAMSLQESPAIRESYVNYYSLCWGDD